MVTAVSSGLDLLLAVFIWLAGFLWVGASGNWTPLAVMAVAGAARLVLADHVTRRLLKPRLLPLALGHCAGAVMIAATYLLFGLLSRHVPGIETEATDLYRLLRGGGYGRASLAVVLVVMSAAEEILWRGRLLGTAEGTVALRWPSRRELARAAVVMVVYALAHAPSRSLTLMAAALLCGLFWSVLRLATGSLWTSIVCHALWDLAVMLVWPLM